VPDTAADSKTSTANGPVVVVPAWPEAVTLNEKDVVPSGGVPVTAPRDVMLNHAGAEVSEYVGDPVAEKIAL
jgi:hypothetical protein